MSIRYLEDSKSFFLTAKDTSYVFKLHENNRILSLYYGKRLPDCDLSHLFYVQPRSFAPIPADADEDFFSLDATPQEYPFFANGDFRSPAGALTFEDGSIVCDFRYRSHRVEKGKESIPFFPQTVAGENDCETLVVTLADDTANVELKLYYTVFEDLNVITRKAKLVNKGDKSLRIDRALSLSLDLPDCNYDFINLFGSHCKERHMERIHLHHGIQSVESRRGASGHMNHPFIALARPETTEESGEIYGFSLIYSGNHLCLVEVDQFETVRVQCGINPFNFGWELKGGENFLTPECVMVFSDKGIGDMSRTFHDLYRNHLAPLKYRSASRPIVINSWEAAYFDFDEKKLFDIIDSSAGLGIDLFVLDDGWFLGRNNDRTSLGDWTPDPKKLPNGLNSIIDRCRKNGLKFGLWFEPEMISPESFLYKEHPDWAITAPNRPNTLSRNQLVLDLTKSQVREYIISTVSDILETYDISYVKWDMNRHITECYSDGLPADRQREFHHRYILGLYEVLETITSAFPDVLFEGCSGGGGRFDPAMLYYSPQIWTSDDSDAVERMKIQYGTSIVYPLSAMTAHISVVPNHQIMRVTPFSTRSNVAMSCSFGYELDPCKLSEEERIEIRKNNDYYRQIEPLVLYGDFYRLKSPFKDNYSSWMIVSKDKNNAVMWYFEALTGPAVPIRRIRLAGLDPEAVYHIKELQKSFTGAALMNAGLSVPILYGDFNSLRYTIERE